MVPKTNHVQPAREHGAWAERPAWEKRVEGERDRPERSEETREGAAFWGPRNTCQGGSVASGFSNRVGPARAISGAWWGRKQIAVG